MLQWCLEFRCWLTAISLLNVVLSSIAEKGPIVTLNHGGQIEGLSTTFQNVPVDLFLGVRYALAPVGVLRFEKPVPATWEGVVGATDVGNFCIQPTREDIEQLVGDEDCLFLYVTVPGGVQKGAKKPAMVWIHGGGYIRGSGIGYVGAPLAVSGDVIVVTFNYRLGFLGFLSDEKANRVTGNYALWDQRTALVWVKKNIAEFGGDRELITVFGESAGGSSVSALTMGRHSDGLFQRAIQQSGSLFLSWSWPKSPDSTKDNALKRLREDHCKDSPSQKSIIECLKEIQVESIYKSIEGKGILDNPFKPIADDDFFFRDISVHSYKLSQRFDLMSGMNGQEGLLIYMLDILTYAAKHNKSIEDGMDEHFTREYLQHKCMADISHLPPVDCVEYLISLYGIDNAADNKERAVRVIEFLGEHSFNHDIVFGLEEHSESTKSTYAYYITEMVPIFSKHMAAYKTMADHGDDLYFVFGPSFLKDEESSIWADIVSRDRCLSRLFPHAKEEFKELSNTTMRMWTNFAKSGNPNKPVPLPAGTPTWPQFDKKSNLWMEINNNGIQVVTTPNKYRLVRLRQLLYADRELQHHPSKHFAGRVNSETVSSHEEL